MGDVKVDPKELREIAAGFLSVLYMMGAEAYEPIGDRLLVKPLIAEAGHPLLEGRKSAGGIYLVDDERQHFALVVGAGKAGEKEDVEAGDVVITGQFIGQPIQIQGHEYRLVPIQDVLAKVVGQ